MLTYQRSPEESSGPLNEENLKAFKMVTSPYQLNYLPSATDSQRYNVDTNSVNPWYRNVSYTAANDPDYRSLFNKQSVQWMSDQITARLKGVHPEGKNILVPKETILSVADSFYQNTQLTVEMLQEMIILKIVEQIRQDFELTKQNNKLSAWVQLYSMDTGLKQWSDAEDWINQKRRTHFYHWNY